MYGDTNNNVKGGVPAAGKNGGNNKLEGVAELSIDQLHMYEMTPKKTFKRKSRPPHGLSIFKVNMHTQLSDLATSKITLYVIGPQGGCDF